MVENNVGILTGDSSAAQQYLDTFRRSEYFEPERALVAAILEDAIHELRKYSRARDAKGKQRFREVEEWIMQEGEDWIFSFDHVCEFLGLDPAYLRRGLRGAMERGERKVEIRQGRRKRAA